LLKGLKKYSNFQKISRNRDSYADDDRRRLILRPTGQSYGQRAEIDATAMNAAMLQTKLGTVVTVSAGLKPNKNNKGHSH
jgi:hypothetical protein